MVERYAFQEQFALRVHHSDKLQHLEEGVTHVQTRGRARPDFVTLCTVRAVSIEVG